MKKIFYACVGLLTTLAIALSGHLIHLYLHPAFNPTEFKRALVHEVDVPEQEVSQIMPVLDQPFTYLGLGKQMTAYESADHKYVLKFFNPRVPVEARTFQSFKKLMTLCSMKWFSRAYFKRSERLRELFERYAMAFREIREETGLVYVHLSPKSAVDQFVEICDEDGKSYRINLKDSPFVLQKKAELAGARLYRLRSEGNEQGFNEAIRQLEELFAIRASKGITDRIQTLHNNYGFLEGRAIQIDVGRISFNEKVQADPAEEVDRILAYIRQNSTM